MDGGVSSDANKLIWDLMHAGHSAVNCLPQHLKWHSKGTYESVVTVLILLHRKSANGHVCSKENMKK